MNSTWTRERIDALSAAEIKNLAKNARDRGAEDVAAICDEALKGKVKPKVVRTPRPKKKKEVEPVEAAEDPPVEATE